jgi:hypothetical protein
MGCLGSSCCAFINSHHPTTTTSDHMLRAASTFGGAPSLQLSSMQWCKPAKLLQSSTTTHWRNGELQEEKRTCVLFYFLLPNQPHTGEVRPWNCLPYNVCIALPLYLVEPSSFNIQEQAADLKWERTVGVQGVEWIVMVKNLAKKKPNKKGPKKKTPIGSLYPHARWLHPHPHPYPS